VRSAHIIQYYIKRDMKQLINLDLLFAVSDCLFPAKWEGAWFQSGVRQSILISKDELSTKGRCLHNEGDKYLLVDNPQ